MSQLPSSIGNTFRARERARGRSRGGHGKYLRARGRGHRGGRPAEFQERLLLEGEQPEELDDDEVAEHSARYARRTIGTNADRYEEPGPAIGPDGQPIIEPEVDLSTFLARDRLEDSHGSMLTPAPANDNDVDHSLAHIISIPHAERSSRKGKAQPIEWDTSLQEMQHEKDVAQAQSDLKERLRASATRQMGKTETREHLRRQAKPLKEAPPLPQDPLRPTKSAKAEMEDFLDDLLD
ncbi:hypothetical protein B0F90DRAFT_1660454 [Multifurca ochricompacta]|uniref:Uncharacterized protein n=1 Tax=Multifurca ochricompacta TaxID=376703 RepID=A0AAD4LS79_9AGAM|nr:hypothetical protein B0F90DRAFT_1660454 [Multifurca ochricompacta]